MEISSESKENVGKLWSDLYNLTFIARAYIFDFDK